MLQIDKAQMISGVQVYGDHANPALFYAVPQMPSFRCDPEGRPIFMYLKYREPRPGPLGKTGGGFTTFDTQFALDDATRQVIMETLRQQVGADLADKVSLGSITWANGTAHINLSDVSEKLVTKVWNPVSPSLYGDNVTPFTVEVPDFGATLFAEAMQGKGGIVQVAYGMNGWVKLPAVTGWGTFHGFQFRHFVQDAKDDAGWGDDSFSDKITELAVNSDVIKTHVDAGVGADPQMVAKIEESIRRTVLDMATKRMAEQIPGYTGDRSVLEDYESIHREFTNIRIDDFRIDISQQTAVLWPFNPQGTLPNITTLVDKKGQPIQWADHYREIRLDDPFFRSFTAPVRVNADFKDGLVHSVDLHVEYQADKLVTSDYHFETPNQVESFSSYTDSGTEEYQYAFKVNYKGTSAVYNAPPAPNKGPLTLNVDDLGVLEVEVQPGNLDFETVAAATVTLEYTPSSGSPIGDQVAFTKEKNAEQTLRWVITEKRDRPIRYRVDYRMPSGQVIERDWTDASGQRIWVRSPFTNVRKVRVFAVGDLTNKIDSIVCDVRYEDPASGYEWSANHVLKAAEPYKEWSFPVLESDVGTVTYSAIVRYKDGSIREIPDTVSEDSTITVGDPVAAVVAVTIAPDLVDWSTNALVKVVLTCDGGSPGQQNTQSVVVRKDSQPQPVVFYLTDAAATKDFTWTATYYRADGTSADTAPVTTADTNLLLPRQAVAP
ncbi:hypothetical protein [Streptomyces bobili]|uniref:hypothetical protein n=1 Tax=Streptomyces bobili TaxID=67280 RepID=UPI000A39A622|nr:hypothetical protein [Streptomyces bobili]